MEPIENKLPGNNGDNRPTPIYRIVGIAADGQRTIVANGLSEPEALQQRARMFGDARFRRLVVERSLDRHT